MGLTSAGYEHSVILCLHILFGALSGQSHTALTGMGLAVDLSTGPGKHLTKDKEDKEDIILYIVQCTHRAK